MEDIQHAQSVRDARDLDMDDNLRTTRHGDFISWKDLAYFISAIDAGLMREPAFDCCQATTEFGIIFPRRMRRFQFNVGTMNLCWNATRLWICGSSVLYYRIFWSSPPCVDCGASIPGNSSREVEKEDIILDWTRILPNYACVQLSCVGSRIWIRVDR